MSFEQLPLIPGAGPRIVTSPDVVMAKLPDALLAPEVDEIRDLLVDALSSLLQSYEFRSDIAASYSDVARSIAQYLSALATDRGAGRAKGEADGALRSRALGAPEVVTETAIVAGVNVIFSLFTTKQAQLVDGVLDAWFIHDGTDGNGGPPTWHSFVGAGPNYPDRYFEDDSANNDGLFRPGSVIGTARVFGDTVGRRFLLRVPDLGAGLGSGALVIADADEPALAGGDVPPHIAEGGWFFVGDGATVPVGAFIGATSEGPLAIYRAVVSFVDAAVGQSIRWDMISDIDP